MYRPAAALLALLLLGASALGQTGPVRQGGAASPGDIAKFQGNGQITGSGAIHGDTTGKGVNPFSVDDRSDKGLCFQTGPTGKPDSLFCLGHDAAGAPQMSVESVGGAANKPLRCSINGVVGDCFANAEVDFGSLLGLSCAYGINFSGGVWFCSAPAGNTSGVDFSTLAPLSCPGGVTYNAGRWSCVSGGGPPPSGTQMTLNAGGSILLNSGGPLLFNGP